MISRRPILILVCGLAAGMTPSRAQTAAPAGVPAKVTVEQGARDIVLVRRSGNEIQYRMPDAPPGVTATLVRDQIKEVEFAISVDMPKVHEAMRRRRWEQAVQLLLPSVDPLLDWLDLPENNAVDPALLAGRCLAMAARDRKARGDSAGADAIGRKAVDVARSLRSADWHPDAASAHLRGVVVLVELGRLPDAERELARARVPEIGDASYGMYGYARSRLLDAQQNPREALESALGSMLYENKDPESFPGAMLQAARSYEEVNEFYRARDVYFEVARLFRGTPAGRSARERLARLMEQGHTDAPETGNLAGVFFGTTEDMNKLCREFLAATAGPETDDTPPETEPTPAPAPAEPPQGVPAP